MMSKSIRFNCCGCGVLLEAPSELLGVHIRCDECNIKQPVEESVSLSNDIPEKKDVPTSTKIVTFAVNPHPKTLPETSVKELVTASNKSHVPTQSPKKSNTKVIVILALVAVALCLLLLLIPDKKEHAGQSAGTGEKDPLTPSSQTFRLSDRKLIADENVKSAVDKIDQMILAKLQKEGQAPNPAIDDVTFLRRTYLALAGRLPSLEEIKLFENDKNETKRSLLISRLLNSSAYTSHTFNYWADILRVIENYTAKIYSHSYQLWLKDAIKSNMPYDKMVNQLVAAKGFIWENGAIGYYARDRGMPLDNMANTTRIFLGIRLECAQCHDHPFDKWTQKDFYQMAAFTHSMDIKYRRPNIEKAGKYMKTKTLEEIEKATGYKHFGWPVLTVEKFKEIQQKDPKHFAKIISLNGGDVKSFYQMAKLAEDIGKKNRITSEYIRSGIKQLNKPLIFIAIMNNNKKLKLPHDYQYDDANPNDIVTPRTMLGSEVSAKAFKADGTKAYADWMTSPENPYFTKVIVNRLWKKAFGVGLVEPADNFNEHTEAYNKELFDYLCRLMKELKYDMRAFQEIIYNTRAWQQEAETEQVTVGFPYYHQGPLLQRMSAEQVWDTLVNLTIANADDFTPRTESQKAMIETKRRIYNKMEGKNFEEFLKLVTRAGKTKLDYEKEKQKLQVELLAARNAKDNKKFAEVRKKINKTLQEGNRQINAMAGLGKDEFANAAYAKPSMIKIAGMQQNDRRQKRQLERDYYDFVKDFARASELPQPTKPGSFLRTFGQSDREVIQNASLQPSVAQSLNMMNGRMAQVITHEYSILGQALKQLKSPEEKINLIYQSLLTRKPDKNEMQKIKRVFAEHGEKSINLVLWSILNSKQFLFIQ